MRFYLKIRALVQKEEVEKERIDVKGFIYFNLHTILLKK